jgi:predicted Zn-dependent protease
MKRTFVSVLVLGLLATSGCYTNPVTGRQSLVLLSEGQELSLGQQSFTQIQQKEKVSANPAYNARVTRVGQRIAQAVGNDLPNAKWEFVVFESDDVNAFALPGGKVGVYTGLLKLAESDAELAIVMGHEIGHVIARHGAERMSESMLLQLGGAVGSAVIGAKTGDPQTAKIFDAAYAGGTQLGVTLPHSRSNESEADRMGAVYAAKAGYDPRASITFWEKMVAQKKDADKKGAAGKVSALMSTHPSDEKRIADLKAMMPQVVPVYEQNKGRYQQGGM